MLGVRERPQATEDGGEVKREGLPRRRVALGEASQARRGRLRHAKRGPSPLVTGGLLGEGLAEAVATRDGRVRGIAAQT